MLGMVWQGSSHIQVLKMRA